MPDYLRIIDLNPTVNGAAAPITSPGDPRAMHFFGFLTDGQELMLDMPIGGAPKINVSWDYANQTTSTSPPPVVAIAKVLNQATGEMMVRYDDHHERLNGLLWIEPGSVPAMGVPVLVSVRAWATK